MTAYLHDIEAKAKELVPDTQSDAVAAYIGRPVDHLVDLPWPFPDDMTAFRYTVNVDPARVPRHTRAGTWGRHLVDLGGAEYPVLMAERRHVLATDPERVKIRPGMELACWDLLIYYLRDLAISYPDLVRLDENGDRFRWQNDVLGTDQQFVLGDDSTLPSGPLFFLASEIPDDLLMVIERNGRLYFDAGAVTFGAAWAASFDIGMDLHEIHGPVPRMSGEGMTSRAEQFLKQLPSDQVYRRINWNLAASPTRTFDISLEKLPDWADHMSDALERGDVSQVQLRIELEHFIRLPMTGAVTFNIRTYMASLSEIRSVPEWAAQLAMVVEELPEDMASYKGFAEYRTAVVSYLRA